MVRVPHRPLSRSRAEKRQKKGCGGFIWSNIEGVRKWIAVLAVFTVGVGIMEA